MWSGYFTVGGMEIANACRTETYAQQNPWFRAIYDCTGLYQVLEEDPYRTPMLDDAPWVDSVAPQSIDFFGFYPLDVTGVEDATASVTFTAATGNGARPSRTRHDAKTIVFDGLLIGCSEAAVEYGMRWLRNALLASPCGITNDVHVCSGTTFCYFAAPPCTDVDSPECWEETLNRTGRTLRKFAVTNGPQVTSKSTATDGSVIWRVTFTAQAGVPWEYGFEQCIVQGFLDPTVPNPFCEGVDGSSDPVGYEINDEDVTCAVKIWAPIYDPTCPPLDPPPGPPSIGLACLDTTLIWTRRQFTIPPGMVPIWTDMVPVLTLTTAAYEVRNLRVRFYADPFGTSNPDEDPCSYCGDFLISYIPPNTVMTLDGATETVTAISQNQPARNANSLVFSTDGGPFDWPLLSCGTGYVVTIDLPEESTVVPIIDMSLTPRAA